MDEGLLRQRRNLMLVSGFLLIFDFADVTIGKVSVLGTELLVGSPEVLMPLAWSLWLYFLVRFYQYMRTDKGRKLSAAISAQLDNSTAAYIMKHPLYDGQDRRIAGISRRRTGPLKWELYHTKHGKFGEPIEGAVWPIARARGLGWALLAFLKVAVNTNYVTDYVLPFAFAAVPLLTVLVGLIL